MDIQKLAERYRIVNNLYNDKQCLGLAYQFANPIKEPVEKPKTLTEKLLGYL